jgi:hypothetical protein
LDFNAQELAPNNALPFRNLLVREVNEAYNSLAQGWGGLVNSISQQYLQLGFTIQDMNTGSFATRTTSNHDVNRNFRPKPIYARTQLPNGGIFEYFFSGSVANNNFITTPIPQADSYSWFMALSGSDNQQYNRFYLSGGQIPQNVIVPSAPSLEGETSVVEGTAFSISAVSELTTIGLDARNAVGTFDKFALSGAAFVMYDYTGSSWLFSMDLSGASGPSGHENLVTAAVVNNLHYVDVSSVSNGKGVMTAMSSAIHTAGLGQVSAAGHGGANPTASFIGITVRSANNPGIMETTSSAQSYSDIFALPDGQLGSTFLPVDNNISQYAAETQRAHGASVDTQGVTATTGYLRSAPFDGLVDYRDETIANSDNSAIFSGTNGGVQYRWGSGNSYSSWQQVRQSQLRSRESIVRSNQINVFDQEINTFGNQVETQRTLDDPFMFASSMPIKTVMSLVDEKNPEDGKLKFRDVTVKHSYGNQRQGFINGDANVKHKYESKDKFLYDSLRDLRVDAEGKKPVPEETGIGRIKSHEISQQIYPQAQNQFLSQSMLRNNFLYTRWKNDDKEINTKVQNDLHVVADLMTADVPNPDTDDKIDGRIELIYRKHNRQVDRLVVGYTNSQDYTLEEHYQHPWDSVDNVVPQRTASAGASTNGTASIWPLDSFIFSDNMYSGSIPILSGVTVGSVSATAQYGLHDAVTWQMNFLYNLGAGELMWFRAGAPARTGSQGFSPQGWYTRRNCQYINQMIHLDFDSLSTGVNYTQSVFGPSMGAAMFMPPWTAGRDRRAVDGKNKGSLIGSRGPFYNKYEDFADGAKLVGRGMGLIPEFRISEHVDHYEVTNNGDYLATNTASYSITGSANLSLNNSGDDGFMKRYQNTDFIKYLSQFMVNDQDINGLPTDLKLQAQAVQRLLPYDGFYPVIRSLQIATLFSQSYAPGLFPVAGGLGGANQTQISASGWQNILDYFYAPGIMYNSIKSGMAVDHPVFTVKEDKIPREKGTIGEVLSGSTDAQTYAEIVSDTKRAAGLRQSDHTIGPLTSGGGSRREITKFYKDIILPRRLGTAEEVQPTGSEEMLAHQIYFPDRIPFETIVNPTDYLLQNKFNSNQTYDWFRNDTTSSFNYYSNNKYVKGAGNFFGAVPGVFLENGGLTTIATDPNLVNPAAISVQSGTLYAMEVALRKTDQFNL